MHILLDVDTGTDDALALLFAARHPEITLHGVTCVAGNVALPLVVHNTLRIMDVCGLADVPVAVGAGRPLVAAPHEASAVHGSDGLGGIDLPAPSRQPDARHAVTLMRDVIEAHPGEIDLVAIGPMTNVALLARMYPDSFRRLRRLAFMGGTVGIGNATAAADFNAWADPEALSVVLGMGIPTLMYGCDVFFAVKVNDTAVTLLSRSADPSAHVAGELLRHLLNTVPDEPGSPGTAQAPVSGGSEPTTSIGDVGLLCALLDPEALTTRRAPVEVCLDLGPARGRTIVDLRNRRQVATHEAQSTGAGLIDVSLAVDGPRLARQFLRTFDIAAD